MPSPRHLLSPSPSVTNSSSPSSTTTSSSSSSSSICNEWGPFHNASNYFAEMAVVLVLVICIVLLRLSLIRYFLRRRRRNRASPPLSPPPQSHSDVDGDPEKPGAAGEGIEPAVVYTAATRAELLLAGAAAAECAICLTEFAEGDGLRVLPACRHGFHAACVDTWLSSRSSCPTCRRGSSPPPAVVEP